MRKQKNRTYAANSKISSVGFQNKAMGANIAISGAMATTSKTMGDMNKIMRPEQIAGDMRAFQQANMKMEMTDEMSMILKLLFSLSMMKLIIFRLDFFHSLLFFSTNILVNETLDDMLEESGDEEETNGIVNQVLDEIGIEISGKMHDAPNAIADSIGNPSKLTEKDIEAQLAKLRST